MSTVLVAAGSITGLEQSLYEEFQNTDITRLVSYMHQIYTSKVYNTVGELTMHWKLAWRSYIRSDTLEVNRLRNHVEELRAEIKLLEAFKVSDSTSSTEPSTSTAVPAQFARNPAPASIEPLKFPESSADTNQDIVQSIQQIINACQTTTTENTERAPPLIEHQFSHSPTGGSLEAALHARTNLSPVRPQSTPESPKSSEPPPPKIQRIIPFRIVPNPAFGGTSPKPANYRDPVQRPTVTMFQSRTPIRIAPNVQVNPGQNAPQNNSAAPSDQTSESATVSICKYCGEFQPRKQMTVHIRKKHKAHCFRCKLCSDSAYSTLAGVYKHCKEKHGVTNYDDKFYEIVAHPEGQLEGAGNDSRPVTPNRSISPKPPKPNEPQTLTQTTQPETTELANLDRMIRGQAVAKILPVGKIKNVAGKKIEIIIQKDAHISNSSRMPRTPPSCSPPNVTRPRKIAGLSGGKESDSHLKKSTSPARNRRMARVLINSSNRMRTCPKCKDQVSNLKEHLLKHHRSKEKSRDSAVESTSSTPPESRDDAEGPEVLSLSKWPRRAEFDQPGRRKVNAVPELSPW